MLKKLLIPAIGLILAGAGCSTSSNLNLDTSAKPSAEIDAQIKATDDAMDTVNADGYSSTGLEDTK